MSKRRSVTVEVVEREGAFVTRRRCLAFEAVHDGEGYRVSQEGPGIEAVHDLSLAPSYLATPTLADAIDYLMADVDFTGWVRRP